MRLYLRHEKVIVSLVFSCSLFDNVLESRVETPIVTFQTSFEIKQNKAAPGRVNRGRDKKMTYDGEVGWFFCR